MGLRIVQNGSNLRGGIKQMASFDHLLERVLETRRNIVGAGN